MTPASDPGAAPRDRYLFTLALAALGVVYGDIGTSPLYAIRYSFYGTHGISVTPGNVLGVMSMVFWSLVIVVDQVPHRDHPRRQQGRRRGARLDGDGEWESAGPGALAAPHHDRPGHFRVGAPVRGRRPHAGDLRAQRRRGARGGDAGAGQLGAPRDARDPRRPVSAAESRDSTDRGDVRPGDARVVRHPRRARIERDRAPTGGAGRRVALSCRALLRRKRGAGTPGARRPLPRRYGRRSAVRGPRALRP